MYLVQKKEGGPWYIVEAIREADGKARKVWRSTGTNDKGRAELVMAEIESSRKLVQTGSQQAGLRDRIMERVMVTAQAVHERDTTWEEVWRIYLADPRTRAMREITRYQVQTSFRRFVRYILEQGSNASIGQVTHASASSYIAHRQKSVRNTSLRVEVTRLHSIWQRVKRPLGLYENIWEDIYLPNNDAQHCRCFTPEEMDRILEAVDTLEEWPLLVRLGRLAGLRFGDCCTLRHEHIAGDWIVRRARKTGAHLEIPIHQELRPYIDAAMAKNRDSEYLLPEAASLYESSNSQWRCCFGRLLRSLKIPRRTKEGVAGFHSLRHMFNTGLIEAGVDPGVRCLLTGHRSLDTNQIYNHAEEAKVRAIGGLPGLAGHTLHE